MLVWTRGLVCIRALARVLTDARGVAGGPPARAELEHASSICSFILRASVAIHRIDTVVLPLFPAWCWFLLEAIWKCVTE